MSLYGKTITVDGLTCGIVQRGSQNGQYELIFEREYAGPEEIETVNWAKPKIKGTSVLPTGYGFTLEDIRYRHGDQSYAAVISVAEQYLGDVTEYQAETAELTAQLTEIEEAYDEQ
jgi:hypothetical protein